MALDFGQNHQSQIQGRIIARGRQAAGFLLRPFHGTATVAAEKIGHRFRQMLRIDRHQSAFFKAAAVLNLMLVEAAISMASPVLGLRP